MYKRFYVDTDILDAVKMALDELYAIKLARAENVVLVEHDRDEKYALDRDRARLAHARERFVEALERGETEQDENEQLAAVDELIYEIARECSYKYGGATRVQAIRSYFESLRKDKQNAYGTFASLVDDQRVKLLAVKFLIKCVLNAATHREKNDKLYMALDSVDAIVEELAKIDVDRPESYHWHACEYETGSWDYRRALRDLHYRNSEVNRLREELAEVQEKLKKYEGENEPVNEQEGYIPF